MEGTRVSWDDGAEMYSMQLDSEILETWGKRMERYNQINN